MRIRGLILWVVFCLLPLRLWSAELDVGERLDRLIDIQQLQNSQLLRVLEEQDKKIQNQSQGLSELRKFIEEQMGAQREILEKIQGQQAAAASTKNGVPHPIVIGSTANLSSDLKARIGNLEKLLLVSFGVGGLNSIFLLATLYILRRPATSVEQTVTARREITNSGINKGQSKKRQEIRPLTLGRPQLEVETRLGRLALSNSGKVTADHIRLYMGTTHSSLERRQKMVTTIQSGGRVELDLSDYPIHDFLYGSLEYKNPTNGKLYKDQFILKQHPQTGEMLLTNPVPRLEEIA